MEPTLRPEGAPRSTVTRPELETILLDHCQWVETEEKEGKPAILRNLDLSGADLRKALLRGADLSESLLRGADLSGACLAECDLTGADLAGADLSGADLRSALLRRANFHEANLRDADLTDSLGLLGGQLGGSVLAGALLPASASAFDGLTNVTEASKTAQNLFTSILLVCSYTWLTVAATTDPQLLNNAAPPSSRLPILGTDIPLVRFYLVAPALLLSLFIYFHLVLQRLWEELAEMPAVFPDGRSVDRRAYPWLMNVLVRAHATRLQGERSPLSRWQARMSIVLAWGLVPMTLVVLWGRYLRAHDWLVTVTHVALVSGAIGAAVGFRSLAARTLRGSERRPFLWRKAWKDSRGRAFLGWAVALTLFAVLSFGAIEGIDPDADDRGTKILAQVGLGSPRRWVPRVFASVGLDPFAHLDDASLSIKPANWTGKAPEELDSVKGADLEGRNLRYAAAYNAFFVNAYLRKVDARGTDFRESDLRRADLREANLRGSNFRSADLREADLRWVDLTETSLRDARLDGARLAGARLSGANLRGAILIAADLAGADLTGADLTDANLGSADLTGVVGLTSAMLASARIDASTHLPESLAPALAARRR